MRGWSPARAAIRPPRSSRCCRSSPTDQIDAGDIIIDAKSGVSGAGRSLKQNVLFTEAGEGLSPYSVAKHRHAPEIEQEVSKAAGRERHRQLHAASHPDEPRRTLHDLCPAAPATRRRTTSAPRSHEAYREEPFVHVAAAGVLPQTQNVRGSNYVQIGVVADRIPGRAIVISVLDNLVKGSAGQAIQNFNLMFGLEETTGLMQQPLFP